MGKNTIIALLTDLRALILKSRPAYRDYLGEVTKTKTMKILENVVLAENQLMLSAADAAFSGFVSGEAYRVVLNDEEKSIIAKDLNGAAVLSNVEDFLNPPNDYWALRFDSEAGKMIALTAGTFLDATISVYYDKTVTEQRWSMKKLAYELLPDRLLSALSAAANTARNALTAANDALTAANDAQITANAAQSTANAAQSTANAAQSTAAQKTNPIFAGSFSHNRKAGTTIGARSFAEGNNTTASKDDTHAEGTGTVASGSSAHAEGNKTTASDSCAHAEGHETVASGVYSHAEGEGTIAQGFAQHVHGRYNVASGAANSYDNNSYLHIVGNGASPSGRSNAHTLSWAGIPWFKGRPQFGGAAQDNGSQTVVANGDVEIILQSSSNRSNKKFRITVDDTGTLSATEVTDTTT